MLLTKKRKKNNRLKGFKKIKKKKKWKNALIIYKIILFSEK